MDICLRFKPTNLETALDHAVAEDLLRQEFPALVVDHNCKLAPRAERSKVYLSDYDSPAARHVLRRIFEELKMFGPAYSYEIREDVHTLKGTIKRTGVSAYCDCQHVCEWCLRMEEVLLKLQQRYAGMQLEKTADGVHFTYGTDWP